MKYSGFRYKDGSNVDLRFAKKRIDEKIDKRAYDLYMKNNEKLTKYLLDVSFHVLHDDFGFGDKRLTKYKDAMISQLECIADDYVDWSDFAGNIKMVEK